MDSSVNGARLDQTIRSGSSVVRTQAHVSPMGHEWAVTESFDRSTGSQATVYTNCAPLRGGVYLETHSQVEIAALRGCLHQHAGPPGWLLERPDRADGRQGGGLHDK